jgi:hypothetical protein
VGAERLVAVLCGVNACAAFANFAALSRLRPSTTWLIRRSWLAVMRASPMRDSAEGVAGFWTRASFGGLWMAVSRAGAGAWDALGSGDHGSGWLDSGDHGSCWL